VFVFFCVLNDWLIFNLPISFNDEEAVFNKDIKVEDTALASFEVVDEILHLFYCESIDLDFLFYKDSLEFWNNFAFKQIFQPFNCFSWISFSISIFLFFV